MAHIQEKGEGYNYMYFCKIICLWLKETRWGWSVLEIAFSISVLLQYLMVSGVYLTLAESRWVGLWHLCAYLGFEIDWELQCKLNLYSTGKSKRSCICIAYISADSVNPWSMHPAFLEKNVSTSLVLDAAASSMTRVCPLLLGHHKSSSLDILNI